jgi:hypothetical protein
MTDATLRMELLVRDFFRIPLKQIQIETPEAAGRTYFIHQDRIVAVAKRGDDNAVD